MRPCDSWPSNAQRREEQCSAVASAVGWMHTDDGGEDRMCVYLGRAAVLILLRRWWASLERRTGKREQGGPATAPTI
jgi:hypothetical protein